MPDILATLIIADDQVAAARALQPEVDFNCALSPTGASPATHYAASGMIDADTVSELAPLCSQVAAGAHDPLAIIANEGLQRLTPPMH